MWHLRYRLTTHTQHVHENINEHQIRIDAVDCLKRYACFTHAVLPACEAGSGRITCICDC